MSIKKTMPCCPLCLAKIKDYSIDTGNKLNTNKVRVTGISIGRVRLRATCELGCEITALAAPPKVTQISLPKPKKRGPIPRTSRAKSSGALKAGWR